MAKQHSIAEARASLPRLIREAESGKTVALTRRGEPVAVLIGLRQFERLTSSSGGFSQAYKSFTREFDLRELAIDPEEVYAGLRGETRGREVDL